MENKITKIEKIYIGPAGWYLPYRCGSFHPAKPRRNFDPLAFIAQDVMLVDTNSSYYHPPSATTAKSWVTRVSDNPHFRFTAKLWQKFVLERSVYDNKDIEAVQSAFDVLLDSGLLGAILIQFPQSFHNKLEERSWLFRILSLFKMYPLVVEFRHNSWNTEQTRDMLMELNTGFANIDQPILGAGIGFTDILSSPTGYFRFHGRNEKMWFNEDAGRDDRYDYTYTKDELNIFLPAIKKGAGEADSIYVVFNNHFKGQALRNAFEFMFLLKKEKLDIPESLLKTYPDLFDLRKPDNPMQLELF